MFHGGVVEWVLSQSGREGNLGMEWSFYPPIGGGMGIGLKKAIDGIVPRVQAQGILPGRK